MISIRSKIPDQFKTSWSDGLHFDRWTVPDYSPFVTNDILPSDLVRIIYSYIWLNNSRAVIKTNEFRDFYYTLESVSELIYAEYRTSFQYYSAVSDVLDTLILTPQIKPIQNKHQSPKLIVDQWNLLLFPISYYFVIIAILTKIVFVVLLLFLNQNVLFCEIFLWIFSFFVSFTTIEIILQMIGSNIAAKDQEWIDKNIPEYVYGLQYNLGTVEAVKFDFQHKRSFNQVLNKWKIDIRKKLIDSAEYYPDDKVLKIKCDPTFREYRYSSYKSYKSVQSESVQLQVSGYPSRHNYNKNSNSNIYTDDRGDDQFMMHVTLRYLKTVQVCALWVSCIVFFGIALYTVETESAGMGIGIYGDSPIWMSCFIILVVLLFILCVCWSGLYCRDAVCAWISFVACVCCFVYLWLLFGESSGLNIGWIVVGWIIIAFELLACGGAVVFGFYVWACIKVVEAICDCFLN